MAKIKLDLKDLSLTDLIAKAQQIATAMTGNTTFTSLSAKVTALSTKITALVTANNTYDATMQLARQQLTLRDNARRAAEDDLRALAAACEGITAEAALLQSGGWELRAIGAPVGALPAPVNLQATGGDLDGTVDCQWDPVRGSSSYLAEWAAQPSGPWTQFYVGPASKCTATELTSGSQYWFRTRAVGAAGPSPWSDPATKRAT